MIKINIESKLQRTKINLEDFQENFWNSIKSIKFNGKKVEGGDRVYEWNDFRIDTYSITISEALRLICTNINIRNYIERVLPNKVPNNDIIDNWEQLLKYIVLLSPEKLEKASLIRANLSVEEIKTIKKVFAYDDKRDGHIIPLFINLNFRTCFYCNRNYIGKFKNMDSITRTTMSLDHFHQKGDFPLLALSLYNLIPSCDVCNSRIKGSRDNIEQYMNPYSDSYDFHEKSKFTFVNQNSIKLESSDLKCRGYIRDFYINEIYQLHNQEVMEIIEKSRIFNGKYLEYISSTTGESLENIQKYIFDVDKNEEELDLLPLAKLKVDLLNLNEG
ncbi:hypothetical protein [Photobacterium ganghwense]|uniref:hypothetical protein n=1 Tax=Photobacterium ganghwense TaxID=320778 RepID=UPI001A90364B|nr:hypothetical protein [Photobacterium ganghwense]QSV13785.1 hypothetical protein FH974_13815 [Photobacterium ganghwense]